MKRVSSPRESRHLSVVPTHRLSTTPLTRAQVAERLGVSISTVRRYEGARLHPVVDDDEVHWFEPKEVACLAVELKNDPRATRRRNASVSAAVVPERSRDELAALVFERLEQRQSLAEIVVGVRVDPDVVGALFEQWCLGLTEGQLQMTREPRLPREHEVAQVRAEELVARLGTLPNGKLTRISIGRFRGSFQHGEHSYAQVVELGGFQVSGPCAVHEITHRFGPGAFRITAYGFDPTGLRWEVLVDGLGG
ncbi:MAG: helix-turn-helix transcriptional regulator [Deltaproteobacteria bacterium]